MQRKIIPYNQHLKELARKLRNESTPGEVLLWQELKAQKLGYDFHRQKPLLNYIVDFYCSELELVIELDGLYHDDILELDAVRDEELRAYNLTVLRFSEMQVRKDMANLLRVIEHYIEEYESAHGCWKDTPQ
ncbi:very-short-patch-repair endonuclease [Mucilaginibacter yixingensis]|uniref:Very-short-patch-repair endonuclease n=1 Tax=Mucilaginibacter yixingensis TaxID=1295612 RepID=A0A2T5J4Z6_9SPHI|nr:DUF559 domain-containing protein [Mucilaginibacter yixingensis]PTQ92888.1 very-short-patch-repair endonuclease [Mucilaginibacter yixingensis]